MRRNVHTHCRRSSLERGHGTYFILNIRMVKENDYKYVLIIIRRRGKRRRENERGS